MKKINFLTGFVALCLALGIAGTTGMKKASALTASDFNAARIIDDGVFFNSNTMNTGDIQNFLNAKVPSCRAGYTCLKSYSQSFNSTAADAYCGGITGGTKSAADIIFNVSRACGVNPQVLIVLLQKEQSLILDDWPLDSQYRIATGYGCPDTAACDSTYYGFFNQVYNAGRQFKRYTQQPQLFNYAVGRTSYILFNPNSACGGTNIAIQSAATAALYNYTPYQPNAGALAYKLSGGRYYSSAHPDCGAYGNLNFWQLFNNWFGPTLLDGFTLARNTSDDTQWVIFGNVRQYVPSAEIISAWGLSDSPVDMTADYLATIPQGPTLGRLFHLIGDPTLYFADSGKKYRVTSTQMRDAWGFTGQTDTYVSRGLWDTPQYAGFLPISVKTASSPSLYMVDGPNGSGQIVLKQYGTPNIYHAWEGEADNYITLSDDYFSQIDNAVGTSLSLTKVAYGGNEYQVIAGQRMAQPSSVASLYPGVAQSVSAYTYNRLVSTSQASHLIRSSSGSAVYLVDAGVKHHITSSNVLTAWSIAGLPINIVNDSFVANITSGSDITGYLADVSGQLYLLDGNKLTVPVSLDDAYRNSGAVYSASSALMNLFTNIATTTGFIKGKTSPQIYLLDNSGDIRHVASSDIMNLYNGYQTGVTIVSDYIVNSIPTAVALAVFVTDGSTEYVVEAGQKASVNSSIKSNWGLSSAQTFSDGTLSRFSTGGALDNKLKDSGFYAYIRGGLAYVTVDQNIANAWGIDTATSRSSKLVSTLVSQRMLTRFVQSSTSSDIHVIDAGNWYKISSAHRSNLGSSNESTMTLDPANAPTTITDWSSVVVKDSSGKHYVIDGGTKRSFANSTIQNHWTNNGAITVPTTSNGFLNLLPNNGTIERAIKGSSAAVYSAQSATKNWIQSGATYQQSYAPFATVTDYLLNAMPDGSPIP